MLGGTVKVKSGTIVTCVNFQFRKFAISLRRYAALFAVIALMSGCSTLTQMQDSLSKFDQGAHSIATSQMAFFNGVHTVECEKQFYDTAYAYSEDLKTPIDLRGKCVDTPEKQLCLNSGQIQIRQNLLDAITLYADQLQALGTSGTDDNKNLDTNLQTIATTLNTEATKHNLSKADASIAEDVEAAIVGLTNMVLDKVRADKIKEAASNQQINLAKVVEALKAENNSLASGVEDYIGTIRAELGATLSAIRKKQGPAVFADVVRARSYLQKLSLFGTKGLDVDDSVKANNDPFSAVKQLNTALDSLVATNKVIATTGTGGIVAAVNDLVARAKAAEAVQAALSK